MRKRIAIFGAGSFGREVLMLIRQINDYNDQWEPIGFYDDNLPKGEIVNGAPVLGSMDALNRVSEPLYVVIGIGSSEGRRNTFEQISNPNISFATLVHPSVQLAPYQNCTIGEGTIICAGNIITVDVAIGRHVLLNLANTIGHDVVIEDFVSMMPGCNISGYATVKEGVYIGSGATLLSRVTVQCDAIVGAGAVVICDVEAHSTVVGVPSKPISK